MTLSAKKRIVQTVDRHENVLSGVLRAELAAQKREELPCF